MKQNDYSRKKKRHSCSKKTKQVICTALKAWFQALEGIKNQDKSTLTKEDNHKNKEIASAKVDLKSYLTNVEIEERDLDSDLILFPLFPIWSDYHNALCKRFFFPFKLF